MNGSKEKKENQQNRQNQQKSLNTRETYKFKSRNMNYRFNVEYMNFLLDNMKLFREKPQQVQELNKGICEFGEFSKYKDPFDELKDYPGYKTFDLYTEYPGLLMGLGNLHDISIDGAYKLGFSFDYVNGLPYLPGSSLKGMLRSVFPGNNKENKEEFREYLVGILQNTGANILPNQIDTLEEHIFDHGDVFFGAYPVAEKSVEKNYIGTEYITPHKDRLKNPNPISFIKVKPNVCFRFSFVLKDDDDEELHITAEQKCKLFKDLILDFGVGAKSNVGFGKFRAYRYQKN